MGRMSDARHLGLPAIISACLALGLLGCVPEPTGEGPTGTTTTTTTVAQTFTPVVYSGPPGTCSYGDAPPAVGMGICQLLGAATAVVEVYPREVITPACDRYGVEHIVAVEGTAQQGGTAAPLGPASSHPYGRWHVVLPFDVALGPITLRLTSVSIDASSIICV